VSAIFVQICYGDTMKKLSAYLFLFILSFSMPSNAEDIKEFEIEGISIGDNLLDHCIKKGIEAKVHYPIPMYRQKALKYLNHSEGDFPITDAHAKKIITFPCDQHLSKEELDYIIETVKEFFN